MSINFTVGIYKYATNPDSYTAKIGNAINQDTFNSGIVDSDYSYPVEIPSYVYFNNIKYEIVEIGLSAFRYCKYIPKIIIPATIITINTWAFDCLFSCTEITFLPGSKLTMIDGSAFCRCYSIKTLVLPSSLLTIKDHAILCMKSLKFLYICGNPSIGTDILGDIAKGIDEVAPDDLTIYVPFEFNRTSQYRNYTKSYFNQICDLTIRCNSCKINSPYLHLSYSFTMIFISL